MQEKNNPIIKSKNEQIMEISLWLSIIIVVILTLLFSFLLETWEWGLMDDLGILGRGKGIIDRFRTYNNDLCNTGVFRPVFVLHSALFYTLFENHPRFFYIFKLIEIVFVLLLWAYLAFRITRNAVSIVLLPVICLSFHYFYDSFFYLSSHEILALLFLGIAIHFFLSSQLLPKNDSNNIDQYTTFRFKHFCFGMFFLLCSFASKETFLPCGIAIGLSYWFITFKFKIAQKRKFQIIAGLLVILFAIAYALFLTHYIKSGYTSSYSLDIPKMKANFSSWLKKDFFNHCPWLFFTVILISVHFNTFISDMKNNLIQWGLLLSILMYSGTLCVLLPWNTICYYATPFGIFFALSITMLISSILQHHRYTKLTGVACHG